MRRFAFALALGACSEPATPSSPATAPAEVAAAAEPDPATAELLAAAACPWNEGLQNFAPCPALDAWRETAKAAHDDPQRRRPFAERVLASLGSEDPQVRQVAALVLRIDDLADPKRAAATVVETIATEPVVTVAAQLARALRGLDLVALGIDGRVVEIARTRTDGAIQGALFHALGQVADRCPACTDLLLEAMRSSDATVRPTAIRALGGGRPGEAGCRALLEAVTSDPAGPVVALLAIGKAGGACASIHGPLIDDLERRARAREPFERLLLGVLTLARRGGLDAAGRARLVSVLRIARRSASAGFRPRLDDAIAQLEKAETAKAPP